MRFSLVIPCYNEEASLALLLQNCKEVACRPDMEIILVDNGSTDGSSSILQDVESNCPGCRSVRVRENRGYGYGILSGLEEARGEVLGWTHADLQADPQDAVSGQTLFERFGSDIFVKGRRYGRPFADVFFTVGMSLFETMLLRKGLWDINAQPTMFPRSFFEEWRNPPHDFSLDLYAYYMAQCGDLPIHRFPVRFGERAHGVSHWNVSWSAKWKFIRRTISFSLELKRNLKR